MKPSKRSWNGEFRGFRICWMDFHNTFLCCGFLCARLISLYFVSLFPATTPRATTPHTYHHGLSRLCIHPGYHIRAITLHQYTYIGLSHPLLVIRTFVVFISPAFTPPLPTYSAWRTPHETTQHSASGISVCNALLVLCVERPCRTRVVLVPISGGSRVLPQDHGSHV